MMRWNSTKTYTEEDIMRMQQEAVLRVHEFQSRAKALPFYDVPESAITPYQEPEPEETPYEAPAAVELPEPEPESTTSEPDSTLAQDSQPEASQEPEPETEPQPNNGNPEPPPQQNPHFQRQEPMMAPHPQPPTDPITGILSKLNVDGETLLILGLMFLLYNEKADHVLLIALAYLLL